MTSPAKSVAVSLDVRVDVRIETIRREDGKWHLEGNGLPAPVAADVVIVACPAPQAQALTGVSPIMQAALTGVTMEPCWALMAAFAHPLGTATELFEPDGSVFSWVVRNNSKPARAAGPETWVAHAHPEWSSTHLELEKEQAVEHLYPAFLDVLGCADVKADYLAAHRWRYARVQTPLGQPFLADETETLFAIGDWCLGPRVECAFESGKAVAREYCARA